LRAGKSLPLNTQLALLAGLKSAGPPPPPPPEPARAENVASYDLTSDLFTFERLSGDDALCTMLLGVGSDSLKFVVRVLRNIKYKHAEQDSVYVLAVMRRQFTFSQLKRLLDVKKTTFRRRFKRCAHVLAAELRRLKIVKLLPLEELLAAVKAREGTFPDWLGNMAWAFIDGTSLETHKPYSAKLQRAMYVTYKRHHALRWTAVCDARGRIMIVTPVEIGEIDDAHVFEKAQISEQLDQFYTADDVAAFAEPVDGAPFERSLCLGADKGCWARKSGAASSCSSPRRARRRRRRVGRVSLARSTSTGSWRRAGASSSATLRI
jgi:hypothetical protein